MHPLAPDLSSLSDADLHKKHGELVQRLNQSYHMGSGLVGQLQMLLDDYNAEIQRRNQQLLDEMAKKSKNFKDIIDIK